MTILSIGKSTYDITIPVDSYPTENSKMIVKDFELIALSIVLDIPFDEIKKLVDF